MQKTSNSTMLSYTGIQHVHVFPSFFCHFLLAGYERKVGKGGGGYFFPDFGAIYMAFLIHVLTAPCCNMHETFNCQLFCRLLGTKEELGKGRGRK